MSAVVELAETRGETTHRWHNLSAMEVLERVGSGAEGLAASEAATRLRSHGRNELREVPPPSPAVLFFRQFRSLIVWVLVVAAVVSTVLGEHIDAAAILAIVLLNAAIGFVQEFNAEKSIAALKSLTAPQCRVWRGRQAISIPAAEVVPGDVLVLEAGDIVAADARVLLASSLACVESGLTGESEPVSKQNVTLEQDHIPLGDRVNMVFMGTAVSSGAGRAVVVATGMHTELGRIAGLIAVESDKETPLQEKLDSFGRVLIFIALGIVVLLFGLGTLRGTPWLELFMTSVSLAVAAVPEGLPAVVTVALALGVSRMVRRRALVRRLPAVETLGSATVICTDKTGTLTVGEMTVRVLYVAGRRYEVSGEGYGLAGEIRLQGEPLTTESAESLLELGAILLGCNNANLVQEGGRWKVVGDPTEGALLVAGNKTGLNRARMENEFPRHRELPFDSDRKLSSVIRRLPDGMLRAFVNGAPDILLGRCQWVYDSHGIRPLTPQDRNAIRAENEALAGNALRVLASARRDLSPVSDPLTPETVEHNLVFVGLAGIYDPPRPEAKLAVTKCREAGIRTVMITGDHPQTARAIGRELGILSSEAGVLTGLEMDELSDTQLRERVQETSVFARVTAEHKLRIVRAWQACGAVVAMTGDGVNDAPAIKGADIGIAMGRSGTEVTKQAADMVITDDNFASIVAAVEEGRGIFDNIRKTLQYLLAGNSGELLLMTLCAVLGLPMPLLPVHLLWINLVTDGLPALCLATDPVDASVMKRRPRSRNQKITDDGFLRVMAMTSFLTGGLASIVFFCALQSSGESQARTEAFTVLVFAELLRSFGCRSEIRPLWRLSLVTNMNLVLVVGVSVLLQLWSLQESVLATILKNTPLSPYTILELFILGSVPLVCLEIVKLWRALKPPICQHES